MDFTDIILMVAIIAGSLYILYRSLWKKKGHCAGCNSETCTMRKR